MAARSGVLTDIVIPVTVTILVLFTVLVQTYPLQNTIVIRKHKDGITCWTCPNKTDNEACNDWAPDRQCPLNHTVCKTIHRIELSTGRSLFVHKQCVEQTDCSLEHVGCHPTETPGVQDCISCCDYNYCNEFVPTNHSTALSLSSLPNSAASLNAIGQGSLILPLMMLGLLSLGQDFLDSLRTLL